MKNILNLLGLCLVFIFLGCEKDDEPTLIPAGIETRISGNIISINGESLSDVEIKIAEYVETRSSGCFNCPAPSNYNYEFKQFVKTINLDSAGNFDFKFTTSGNGNFYTFLVGDFLQPWNGQGFPPFFEQKIHSPFGINLTQHANDMAIIGKEFSTTYAITKLYLCEVNLQFNLTNSYPIEPYHLLTYPTNNRIINTFTNPTTLKLFIDKANPQTLILNRNRDNGIRQKAEYIFPASNVENTTFQSIIVNETDFVDY